VEKNEGKGKEAEDWAGLWDWAIKETDAIKTSVFEGDELGEMIDAFEIQGPTGLARPSAGTGPKLDDLLRYQSTGRPLPGGGG
jgi:hypothetical protein